MIVNPGIRRFLGSAIQRLFNSASFYAPLTHSLALERGTGSPTFTRASTATGQKWDEAGYLDFTALAGEVVFKGARREYNQWTTSSVSLASGANKSLTLAAGTYQFSMGAGTGTATFSGTGGATGTLAASTDRVSVAKTITAGTFVVTASVADLAALQVCDITGETDQTTIRPYVSVGVESAPAYHGSMVDGVKCYDTDRSGNPISTTGSYPLVGYVPWEARTNLCLQSNAFGTAPWADFAGGATGSATQNAVGVTGASNTAWTLSDTDATKYYGKTQSITVSAGTTYTQSLFFAKTTGATTFPYFELGKLAGTLVTCGAIVNTNTGTLAYPVSQPATAIVTSHNALFWRVEFSQPTGTTISAVLTVFPAASSTGTTLSASATGSCIVEGSQYELGAFATPYIPTTTVAVARNADLLTYTGADVANIKTLAATFSRGVGVSNAGAVVGLNDNTFNNYVYAYLNSATQFKFEGYAGGVEQWRTTASNAYTPGASSKAAQGWITNSVKMDLDGTAQTEDTTATPPVVTRMDVGHIEGAAVLNGPVNHIYGWTRDLSQSELDAITA